MTEQTERKKNENSDSIRICASWKYRKISKEDCRPDDKKIFLICTYGGSANYKSIEQILDKKHASVVGKFGCKGYDTFGPFKLVGGIAKGHPNEEDMKNAADFVKGIH